MGLDVVLMRVTQRGTGPKRRQRSPLAVVSDEGDVLAREFPVSGTPMLSRADPYGDLVLTPAEMEQFIEEAQALLAGADEAFADPLRRVLALARRCREDPRTELHLQGD
jgi:hypothetical protein